MRALLSTCVSAVLAASTSMAFANETDLSNELTASAKNYSMSTADANMYQANTLDLGTFFSWDFMLGKVYDAAIEHIFTTHLSQGYPTGNLEFLNEISGRFINLAPFYTFENGYLFNSAVRSRQLSRACRELNQYDELALKGYESIKEANYSTDNLRMKQYTAYIGHPFSIKTENSGDFARDKLKLRTAWLMGDGYFSYNEAPGDESITYEYTQVGKYRLATWAIETASPDIGIGFVADGNGNVYPEFRNELVSNYELHSCDFAEVTVKPNSPPSAFFSIVDPIVLNTPFKASALGIDPDGHEVTSYDWELRNGFGQVVQQSNIKHALFTVFMPGNYELTLTTSDGVDSSTFSRQFTVALQSIQCDGLWVCEISVGGL